MFWDQFHTCIALCTLMWGSNGCEILDNTLVKKLKTSCFIPGGCWKFIEYMLYTLMYEYSMPLAQNVAVCEHEKKKKLLQTNDSF